MGALIGLIALLVAACGGGPETTVSAVVDRHFQAIADGDGPAACRDLTAEAGRLVVVSVNAAAGSRQVRTCRQAFEAIAAGLDDTARTALRESDHDVTIDSDGKANVDSSATTGETQLERIAGDWKITNVAFGS